MNANINVQSHGFAAQTCCTCGIAFYMPDDFERRRRNDHAMFYCPSGHPQHYTEKSEAERLKEQLAEEQRRTARAEEGRKWAEANAKGARIATGMARAAKTRLEHRVNCGVCPHCRRTFQALARHIKSKHPEHTK